MSNDKNKDLKQSVSDFIGSFSKSMEKAAHVTIDKTGEFTGFVKDSIKEGFEQFSGGVQEFIELIKQVDVTTLVAGDLVVSKTDIKRKDGTVLHKAGDVFEFSEDLIPLLGESPLFVPDTKTAVKFARLDEIKKLYGRADLFNPIAVDTYLKVRTEEIKAEKKVEEPVHA